MKVISDEQLGFTWKGWSGGHDTLQTLNIDELRVIQEEIEELYPDGIDETTLNDFLWFDRDTIAVILGYDNWEKLEENR